MINTDIGALAVWGFLAGFVVWGSLFRVVQPIADWLLPVRPGNQILIGVTRLLVWAFLVIAAFLIVDAMRLMLTIGGRLDGHEARRNAFGVELLGSVFGLIVFGIMRRFAGVWQDDETV